MGKGKLVAQGAHASLRAYQNASDSLRSDWEAEGEKKVVVAVNSRKELLDLHRRAKQAKIPCAMVKDAGLTQTRPGTLTAVALGPAPTRSLDALTKHLKLL